MTSAYPESGLCRHEFTIIELLAAMTVFLVIMVMLFSFFSSAQRAWSYTNATTELFSNARLALDVISSDLQAAIASENDVPGQSIKFHQGSANTLQFVTANRFGDGYPLEYSYVGYRLANNRFQRASLSDTPLAGSAALYQNHPGITSAFYTTCAPESGVVADGVLGLSFTCQESTMATPSYTQSSRLPAMVTVNLRLMDSKSMELYTRLSGTAREDLESRMARNFTKTIFIGGRRN